MTLLRRALNETRHALGLEKGAWTQRVVGIAAWGLAGVLLLRSGRLDLFLDEAQWAAAAAIGLLLVGGATFGINLIRAPYLLERDKRQDVERERNELRAGLASRPSAEVEGDRSSGDDLIRVRNIGAPAVFRAHMRILESSVGGPSRSVHRLWWERARAIDSKIVTGADDYFRIARTELTPPEMVTLSLYHYDERFGMREMFWNYGYVPDQTVPPVAELELTITAEPELVGGPIVKRLHFGPIALKDVS